MVDLTFWGSFSFGVGGPLSSISRDTKSLNLTLFEPSPDWAVFPVYGHRELHSLGLGFEGRIEADLDWFSITSPTTSGSCLEDRSFYTASGFQRSSLGGNGFGDPNGWIPNLDEYSCVYYLGYMVVFPI